MALIKAVLFDLDGTLLDTATDMAYALNQQRLKHGQTDLPLETIKPHVGYGARSLLKVGFNIDEHHPTYTHMLEEYLTLYQSHLANETRLFPEMDEVLNHLDAKQIPWGIVTNKSSRFTFDLLKALDLYSRAACIICGDSLSKRKPDPAPILHACQLIKMPPEHCIYVGDTITDVMASKGAGTLSLVALYGYIGSDDPYTWEADGYIKQPSEIIDWMAKSDSSK